MTSETEWTPERRERLTAALREALPDPADLLRVVRLRLGIPKQEVYRAAEVAEAVAEVVAWAAERNRLPDLLEAALQEKPEAPGLRALRAERALRVRVKREDHRSWDWKRAIRASCTQSSSHSGRFQSRQSMRTMARPATS